MNIIYVLCNYRVFYLLSLESLCSIGMSGYLTSSDEDISVSVDNSYSLSDLLECLPFFFLFRLYFCFNFSLLEERLFVFLALLAFCCAVL